FNADGSLAFTAHYPADQQPANLVLQGTGQGTSGYLFAVVNFTNPTETSWFNNPGNYVGMSVSMDWPFLNVDAGSDNFFPYQIPGDGGSGQPPPPGAPLPAAAWGGMALLGLLGAGATLRRRLAK